MKTINPASKQLFAKPQQAATQTASGILLGDAKKFMPQFAEVINVGSEVKQYSPHDTIVYKEYAATELELDDEEYILIAEEDVLGNVVETSE